MLGHGGERQCSSEGAAQDIVSARSGAAKRFRGQVYSANDAPNNRKPDALASGFYQVDVMPSVWGCFRRPAS